MVLENPTEVEVTNSMPLFSFAKPEESSSQELCNALAFRHCCSTPYSSHTPDPLGNVSRTEYNLRKH